MRTPRTILTTIALAATVAFFAAGPSEGSSGLPITTCGQVVTTNAFLTEDLTCPGTAGVVVGASGITIDLKGFTLRGDRTTGHYGIDDTGGYDAVKIKDGVVRNFDTGVYGNNGADKLGLLNVLVSGNSHDGVYVSGVAASLKSTTASGNLFDGIVVEGSSAKFQSSTASANHDAGISVIGDSVKIQSTTASGNDDYGVFVFGASATVQSSTVSGNGVTGIWVGGDAPVIKGNRAEANGFAGGNSDLAGRGIHTQSYTTAPVGINVARGNDDPADCAPSSLC